MGPKLMNCCKPEQVGTKEYGKMSKRIRNWKIEGQKNNHEERISEASKHKFEMEGFMAQKGLWKLAREKVLQDRGEWCKEEGDVVREYKASMKTIS